MNVDRVAAARERVREVRAELNHPARDFPCVQCRYFEIHCTHPAVSKVSVSPITGGTSAKYPLAEDVRAEDGACGPEGALFDARSVPGQLVVSFLMSGVGRWALLIGSLIAIDALLW